MSKPIQPPLYEITKEEWQELINTSKKWFLSYDLPLPKRKLAEYKPKIHYPEY